MRGRGSLQEGDPFTEVMTLITHMYKQTAIAKVKEAELILILFCGIGRQCSFVQVSPLKHNMFRQTQWLCTFSCHCRSQLLYYYYGL